MKTTGLFEILKYHIPCKVGETITLIPFGDIHRSAPMCDEEKWLEFVESAKSIPNLYLLGMGDYDDMMSSTERQAILKAELHDSTVQTLELLYQKNINKLTREIASTGGKVVGLLEGNHFAQFGSGLTSTQIMCQTLGCKYLGCVAFVRLVLGQPQSHRSATVDIFAHHGLGAARLLGGSLNAVQQMAHSAVADLYFMGHDHKRPVAPIDRLQLCETGTFHLSNRKGWIARTGSFLKGYVPGKVSYVADKCLPPSDLGLVKFAITLRRHRSGNVDLMDVDIHPTL